MSQCFCPETTPDWHEQDVDLSGHAAHILPIAAFLKMPLSYGTYLQKQQYQIEELELQEPWPGLVLTQTGMWGGKIVRLLTSSQSPSRFVSNLENNFTVRGFLHPGGIGTIRDSMRKLQNSLFDMGRMPGDIYLCHLTCPECEQRKGGDKILLLRRWKSSSTLEKRLKK
ncbi:MAG: hypothetical protein OEZ68_16835 [Gammaproteobacteria bacterium]|nr:hypothetical protein [Gammaproteobacteria bacterium]MDH5802470.1 hypothetical protein [Gammaproteobacteria bacterium]